MLARKFLWCFLVAWKIIYVIYLVMLDAWVGSSFSLVVILLLTIELLFQELKIQIWSKMFLCLVKNMNFYWARRTFRWVHLASLPILKQDVLPSNAMLLLSSHWSRTCHPLVFSSFISVRKIVQLYYHLILPYCHLCYWCLVVFCASAT